MTEVEIRQWQVEKRPDRAWLFYPLACWLTFWEYSWGRIDGKRDI